MKLLPKSDALARLAAEAGTDAGGERVGELAGARAGAGSERVRGSTCRMCELAREATPVAISEHAVAILDRYAARPGHVLVILRRHEEHLASLAWHEYEALHRLAWQVNAALDATLRPRRVYIAALGSSSPLLTSFPHVHVHVIPLTDGGELDRPANVFTWVNGVYVFDDADEERELRESLQRELTAARASTRS